MNGIVIGICIGIYLGGAIITSAVFYAGIKTGRLFEFKYDGWLYIIATILWPILWVLGLLVELVKYIGDKIIEAENTKNA